MLFSRKYKITRFRVVMNGEGHVRYEVLHGDARGESQVTIKYVNGDKEFLYKPNMGEILVYRAMSESQPRSVVPHQAVCYWEGTITPDQALSMESKLVNALRNYLQENARIADETYTAVTVAWSEFMRRERKETT